MWSRNYYDKPPQLPISAPGSARWPVTTLTTNLLLIYVQPLPTSGYGRLSRIRVMGYILLIETGPNITLAGNLLPFLGVR